MRSKLSKGPKFPDRPCASEIPSTRYFPIAIITLIRVNRVGTPGALYHIPFSKLSDEDTTIRKCRYHQGSVSLDPFESAGRTFTRRARGTPSRGASRRRRVNYIFVLPILGKPGTGLLPSPEAVGLQKSQLSNAGYALAHTLLREFESKRRRARRRIDSQRDTTIICSPEAVK